MQNSNLKIKTRITSNANGSGNLTIRVNNGWSFTHCICVENTQEIRDYLKSDDFKEFAYSVFKKYEDMTYNDICALWETDIEDDFKKIDEKLDNYLWKPEEEPFRITIKTKLLRTYSNGFRYKVVFGNNKSDDWCSINQTCYAVNVPEYANEILGDIWYLLEQDEELEDKLATYSNWYDFDNDFMKKDDISKIVNNICEKCA
jgi:hypothetical protein